LQIRHVGRNPPRLILGEVAWPLNRRAGLAGLAFLEDDRDRMARLGIVLYWAAAVIAIAVVVLAGFAYFTATGTGALQGAMFIVAFAGLVWLIGRAILYLLAGR
jgi:hypothetical protein